METNTITQARDRVKMLAASARLRQRAIVSKRCPDIRRAASVCERARLEVFWQNANNLKGNLIQQHSLADRIWIPAKTADPIRITEHYLMPAAGSILFVQ